MAVDHPPLAPCDSVSVRIEKATQIPTQNPTHGLLAGGRRVSHPKIGHPPKDQAAERLTSSCGFMRSLAKRAVTPRVGWFRLLVLLQNIGFSPKGGVKSGVRDWWQGVAGGGKRSAPKAVCIRHQPAALFLWDVGVDPDDHLLAVHHAVGLLVAVRRGKHQSFPACQTAPAWRSWGSPKHARRRRSSLKKTWIHSLDGLGKRSNRPSLRQSIRIRSIDITESLHDANSLSGRPIPVLFLLAGGNENARSRFSSGW